MDRFDLNVNLLKEMQASEVKALLQERTKDLKKVLRNNQIQVGRLPKESV